ncbi:MAG: hypothetical protein OXC95_14215 [Dehalococcoidia bacterium]|nr:hypothetical protein [Dehalococcoidia bacterium]
MVVESVLEGIQVANKVYEKWSMGWWTTDSGVEGYVVSEVARRLYRHRDDGQSLLMEVPFSYIEEWSEARRRGGPRRRMLRGNRRADIVIFDPDDYPAAVVEIKRRWSARPCFRDLKRIRDLIIAYGPGREGSLEMGCLAFMVQESATTRQTASERVDRRIEAIRQSVQHGFHSQGLALEYQSSGSRRYPPRYQRIQEQGEWAHAAVCIALSAR